MVIEALRFRP